MKLLITGGGGFIGSHIHRLLLQQKHQVVIFDRKLNPVDDLLNKSALNKALKGVEAVIHMASLIEVGESVKYPFKFAENNILGSVNLLETMKEQGVKKIIFSSSACVYGVPEKLPIKEDAKLKSANPYGASKVAVENFCQAYYELYKFDVTILRYFNPFGPGENHYPETHAIPNFIKAALAKKPIPLYWKGKQVRDFIYVEDLAAAHIAPLKLKGFHIFNVGSEKGIEIIDVVKKLSDILGYKLEIKDLGKRTGDVTANYASSKALQKATGWKPKFNLDQGLRLTVDWFKKQRES